MTEKDLKVIADATAMIRTYDVHEAAKAMAKSLKLNAEVKTVVGKWDERGQITGWTKVGKTRGPVKVLVEVFVSDIAGENREFDRYRRNMEELIAENAALRARPAPPLHGYADGVEAVRKWLKHDGLCGLIGGYDHCTCGLEEALALTPKEPQP